MMVWDGEDEPVEPSEHANLTVEDLAIDDTLSDVERVVRYSTSQIELQRFVHVKLLAATAQEAGYKVASESFFPLLKTIVQDPEYLVRQQLAIEIKGLCNLCAVTKTPDAYAAILNELLPIVGTLLCDSILEVRSTAVDTLSEVASLIAEEDRMEHILSLMLSVAHQDSDEVRITAPLLLNKLAEAIGEELFHQFVLPEVISLSEDQVFRIRKSVSCNLNMVFKVAKPSVTQERLVPAFRRLASDSIWGVRKACAESLPGIAEVLPVEARVEHLIEIQEKLAKDQSKWVRRAVLQRLGRFISTLPAESVTESLLDSYLSLANSQDQDSNNVAGPLRINSSKESEDVLENTTTTNTSSQLQPPEYHCAFTFPAVVLTLGHPRWQRLKSLFLLLVQDSRVVVRRVMSHSLHELAKILGEETTDADLLPAFDLFLQDRNEVKVGVLKNLCSFLSHVSLERRRKYIDVLETLREESKSANWRLRLLLAQQAPMLTQVLPDDCVETKLSNLCLKLLEDDVQEVVTEANKVFRYLLKRVSKKRKEAILRVVLDKASGKSYQIRQQYIAIAEEFLLNEYGDPKVASQVLSAVLRLVSDKVPNVRMSLAKTLRKEKLSALPGVAKALVALKGDAVLDVAMTAGTSREDWETKYGEALRKVKMRNRTERDTLLNERIP